MPSPPPRRRPSHAHSLRALCLLALLSCLSLRAPADADAQAQLVLKIATTAAHGSPLAEHLRAVAKDVQSRSQGATHTKVFTDGVLGDSRTLIARTVEGSIQMFAGELQSLAETVPGLGILTGPFVFGDEHRTDRALDRRVRSRLDPLLQQQGLVFGGWAGNAERVLISPRPLRRPADFEGAALRLPGPHADLWHTALGTSAAGPFPVTLAEGAQAPIVDATPLDAAARGLHRHGEHVLRARHAVDVYILVFSKRWFDGLPAAAQRDLRKPEHDLTRDARNHLRSQNRRVLDAWVARGMRVHTADKGERRALKRALRKVPGTIARRVGEGSFPLWRAAR